MRRPLGKNIPHIELNQVKFKPPTASFVAASVMAALMSAPPSFADEGQSSPSPAPQSPELTPTSQIYSDRAADPDATTPEVDTSEDSGHGADEPEAVDDTGLPSSRPGSPENHSADSSAAYDINIDKLMVAGDSISQGAGGDWTWRYRLWKHLDAHGESIDFVGPYNGLYDQSIADPEEHVFSYRDPDFDQDHNALWGNTVAEAKETIDEEVEEYQPDALLLLIGLNDIVWFETSTEEMSAHFRQYITNARSGNPDLHIIASELLPTARAGEDEEFFELVEDFNEALNSIAVEMSTSQSPITVIDIAEAEDYVGEEDNYDGVHPGASGELKIAANFADVLASSYSVGAPYARPLPDVEENGPVGEPELSLEELSPGRVELSWGHVDGASAYWVWVMEPDSDDWERLPYALSMDFNPWISEGLLPGGQYSYKIQAARGNIPGEFSNTVTYEIEGDLPDPPAAVENLTVEPADGSALLSWEESDEATGYYIHVRNVSFGEEDFTRLPYPVTGEEWTAELLFNGAQYEFKVESSHGFIAGGITDPVGVTPVGPLPLGPTNVTAESRAGSATLRWSESENATGYYVFVRNVTLGDENFTRLPFPVSGGEWTDDLLVNGAEYEYKLQAVNGFLEGEESSTVRVTPTVDPPDAPANFSAQAGDGEVTLTWNPVDSATGYYIYTRNLHAGESDFTRLPYSISETSWTAEALLNGADYEFRVRSVSGLIEGAQSSTAGATPTGPAPGAPTNLSVRSGDREAILTWDMPEHATCVYLQARDVSQGETSFTELPFPICEDSWVVEGLVNGGQYDYRLRAYNGLIAGGTSSHVRANPSGPGASGPETLNVTGGNGNAALSWSGTSRATGYYVWVRSTTLGQEWQQLPFPLAQTSWIDRSLVNGVTYQFRVQSVDGYEEGGFSNTVTVTPQGPRPQVSGLTVSATPGQATLRWNRSSTADGYVIFMRNRSNNESFTRMPYPVTQGSWTAEYLTPGHTYEFQVLALNGLQEGARTATVSRLVPAPAMPGGFTVSRSGPYAAQLSWNSVSGVDGYVVYHGVSQDPFTQPTMSPMPLPTTQTSHRATYLFTKGFHWFAVASTKYGAAGARSTPVSMTPLMHNVYHYEAHNQYFGGTVLPGYKRDNTSAPRMGRDGGILVSRAFIADEGIYGPISDKRGYDARPSASARIHVAWDADRGRLSALGQSSCTFGACIPALPISLTASNMRDGVPLTRNYVWTTQASPSLFGVAWKAPNSVTAGFIYASAHIDASTAFRHQGGSSFSASLVADGFPTYESYQYPMYSTNGNASTMILTRCGQDHIGRLYDMPSNRRTC
ncbi:fibronectin type III domain-containing protein [Nocardiopsis terrae]|uniref:fibronectin type III domain-containing protein n=1 Tax=Nocardiopsis terrae TaxID=372655 RepID=UPI001749CE20|nr:fibronectin type III domain-containing protein [Nocardiopsis terrae]